MKFLSLAGLVLSALSAGAFAGSDISTSCQVRQCLAGTKVVTFATKSDPFFACDSMEMSEYTNTVLGLISISIQFTGHLPNISDKTGDPILQGETKTILDNLRTAAGVKSLNEAMQHCTNGAGKRKLIVMNFPSSKADGSMYVEDTARRQAYWMPKGSADPIK
jgi:hypothetical protein